MRFGFVALAAVLMLAPLIAGGFLLYSLSLCLANALAVLSVSVLVRYGGEVSIGHGFFVAVGAYTVAIMEHQLGLSVLAGALNVTFSVTAVGFPAPAYQWQ